MSLLFTQLGMRIYHLWTQSSGLSGHRDLLKIHVLLYSFSPQDPRKAATSENYVNTRMIFRDLYVIIKQDNEGCVSSIQSEV